jgi:hypothetical protein
MNFFLAMQQAGAVQPLRLRRASIEAPASGHGASLIFS